MIECCPFTVSMFGMNDPAQTLMQLESYLQGDRLEMTEVMATQFTDMFLSKKTRTQNEQAMLVRGLQILCDVLIMRSKFVLAMTSAKTLLRERRRITEPNNSIGHYYQDLQRCGNSFALAGKKRKAKSFFVKAFKHSGGCVAATLDGVIAIKNDRRLIDLFLHSLDQSGPVTRSGESFIVQPDNLPAVEVDALLQALEGIKLSIDERVNQHTRRLRAQIAAIESGEMAANAKLQSALDSLQPKHDYYEYS